LETRSDYIVVLLGDSGNRSKKFTIVAKAAKEYFRAAEDSTPESSTTSVEAPVPESDPADDRTDVVMGVDKALLGRDVEA
jgi:hypothetical protein